MLEPLAERTHKLAIHLSNPDDRVTAHEAAKAVARAVDLNRYSDFDRYTYHRGVVDAARYILGEMTEFPVVPYAKD